jgi:vacuolar-type H+-ATPase subunit I/STV1
MADRRNKKMIKQATKTVSAFLKKAQTIIKNSRADAKIKTAMAAYGYDDKRLDEGQRLLDAANDAADMQIQSKGTQAEETDQAKEARVIAEKAYEDLAKILRGEFIDEREQLTKLGLNGAKPRTIAGFIQGAKTLFDNASSDPVIKAAVAKYGYDDARMAAEKQKVLDYEKEYDEEQAAIGGAQDSTSSKNTAMHDLRTWISQYIKVARVALSKNKTSLAKLGIVARTTKTKAQRNAPKKAAATKAAKRAAAKK